MNHIPTHKILARIIEAQEQHQRRMTRDLASKKRRFDGNQRSKRFTFARAPGGKGRRPERHSSRHCSAKSSYYGKQKMTTGPPTSASAGSVAQHRQAGCNRPTPDATHVRSTCARACDNRWAPGAL